MAGLQRGRVATGATASQPAIIARCPRCKHGSPAATIPLTACAASPQLLYDVASSAVNLQDVIVSGAVFTAVGAAMYSGLKKDPVPCELCVGSGGTRCFACEGQGKMSGVSCSICKGVGLVLCRKCRGGGYTTGL